MSKTEYADRAMPIGPCTERTWPEAHRVRATENLSHSQVFSARSRSYRLVNRWDDLELMRTRPNPNLRRYQVRGATVTRVI